MKATKAAVPSPTPERFESDDEGQRPPLAGADAGVVTLRRQPGEAEDRYQLHHAEQPQRAVDADPHHPQAAEQAADHRRPQPGILGDQADVGLGEAHVEVERRGQRGAHAVAELVEER